MKNRRFVLFVSILSIVLLLAPSLYAQKMKVDGDRIKSYIEYMADSDKFGRKPATPEFNICLEWAAEKFREWGLEPAGDNGTYFHEVPIKGRRASYHHSKGIPELTVRGRKFYFMDQDFSINPISSTGSTIRGDIVFAGYGISAPHKGLDEYEDIDVRGKIVLVLKGSPSDAPAINRRMSGASSDSETEEEKLDEWKDFISDETKYMTAYEKGASGIIIYTPEDHSAGFSRGPGLEASPFTRPFVIFTNLDHKAFRWIMKPDPQESIRAFTRRLTKIRNDIKNKQASSELLSSVAVMKGYDKTEMYGPDFGNNKCRNVVAKIEGTDRRLKNEFVIMGGHYDHLGVRNGLLMNGADDNASGSAVVMEVARVLKENNFKPKRTIIFCLWTAEELGLLGSNYFVESPPEGIDISKVVTYFNMDMVGLGTRIGAPGGLNFPEIWEVIMKDQDTDVAEALQPSTGGPGGSDHSAFITKGIESMALMTRGGVGHNDYHDSGDDTDLIDPEILRKTGQFVLQGTVNLANEKKVDLIIEDRQHIYDGLMMNMMNINLELKARRTWSVIDAPAKHRLLTMAKEKAIELKNPENNSRNRNPYFRMRRGSNITQGIGDIKVFDGCVATMSVVHALLDFGRADFKGDDGNWLSKGVTDKGELAIKYLENNGVAINLVDPTPESLSDMLEKTTKSFLITGYVDLTIEFVNKINDKGAIVTVDFDPSDVDACVSRLEELKAMFGDTDNFVLYLKSTDNLDDAKKDFYLKLIKKGWTKEEIYAVSGASTARYGRDTSNLGKLGR